MVGHGWPPPKASARPVTLRSGGSDVNQLTEWSGTAMVSREGTIPPAETGAGLVEPHCTGRPMRISVLLCTWAPPGRCGGWLAGTRVTPGFAGLMTIV
ncbi:hypothetical protein AORI_1701 [Amycolatopsis keratiniphila]|uniref:Uncharacterized protein n=1 Tax=Amycolatopsis keratiniphila TaxID=129921 RepID=R4SL30_9PSEU|nr:hypothetical protein AORI_1701 [Amycolatopsis keratiniphila]